VLLIDNSNNSQNPNEFFGSLSKTNRLFLYTNQMKFGATAYYHFNSTEFSQFNPNFKIGLTAQYSQNFTKPVWSREQKSMFNSSDYLYKSTSDESISNLYFGIVFEFNLLKI